MKRKGILLLFGLLLAIAILGIYYQKTHRAYAVQMNGKTIGLVANTYDLEQAFIEANKIQHGKQSDTFILKELGLTSVFASRKKCTPLKELAQSILDHSTVYENAWVVYKKGAPVTAVRDRSKALDALSEFKSSFLQDGEKVIKQLSFLDKVELKYEAYPFRKVLSIPAFRDMLLQETSKTKILLGAAATAEGGSANGSLRELEDREGVFIVNQSPLSFDVRYTAHVKEEITLPRSTIFHYDETLPVGERVVEREGVDGILHREVEREYINSTMIYSHVEKEEVIKDPVSTILRVGDKSLIEKPTFAMPAKGVITSGYGPRYDGFHRGVDVAGSLGSDVTAAKNGIVSFAGFRASYGYVVIISHADGYETRYAHLLTIKAKSGDAVQTGDVIGTMGSSGNSTGAHVHFEILKDEETMDPEWFLRREEP